MATNDKERQVIHRAVRVLDEIESRIHELREELEANGMSSPKRGRRKAEDDGAADDHESQPQGRGKAKAGDDNLHGAAKAAHEAKTGEHDDEEPAKGRAKADAKHDDDREPHGQGRVKHPESDKRLKGHKDDHEGDDKADTHAKHDDDRQPHGQGRVKHPESDKRLKGHKDDEDASADKAEPAAKG